MCRRWFMFEHPTNSPKRPDGSTPPGFRGAHLVDVLDDAKRVPGVNMTALCGTVAKVFSLGGEPSGFVPACCACLAISEVSHA